MIDTETRPTVDAPAPPPGGNVTSLVSGILDDAQKLAHQQLEMLKAEVREDFRRSKRAAEYGGLGIVLLTVGCLGLVMALANFLHEYYQFSLWASWGITGGLFLVVGGALAATSYILLERFNPLPDKTFNALQENLTWKTST
jgi:hypothetical protein